VAAYGARSAANRREIFQGVFYCLLSWFVKSLMVPFMMYHDQQTCTATQQYKGFDAASIYAGALQ